MNEFVCEIRSGIWCGQALKLIHRIRSISDRSRKNRFQLIDSECLSQETSITIGYRSIEQFHLIHFFGVWNWQHRFHTRRILNNEINHLVVTCFFSEYEFDFEITQLIDLNTSASFKTKKIVFFPLLLSDVCNRPIFILTSLKRTIIKCQWV